MVLTINLVEKCNYLTGSVGRNGGGGKGGGGGGGQNVFQYK